ncbi:hypothetical protein DSM104635_02807 [Terricaulis silvestris]|uniref:Uncharacterized protein n=1 Tax=Terricaulis silvestris TaxID=2686094 RepID=A0A6I6MWF5_9CAUL|nr:hypothetical protein DSM104635_02807 [Terricaulis silvestris]
MRLAKRRARCRQAEAQPLLVFGSPLGEPGTRECAAQREAPLVRRFMTGKPASPQLAFHRDGTRRCFTPLDVPRWRAGRSCGTVPGAFLAVLIPRASAAAAIRQAYEARFRPQDLGAFSRWSERNVGAPRSTATLSYWFSRWPTALRESVAASVTAVWDRSDRFWGGVDGIGVSAGTCGIDRCLIPRFSLHSLARLGRCFAEMDLMMS